MKPRPDCLNGVTYAFALDQINDPLYLTINHIEKGGKKEIYEVFINCHDSTQLEWITVAGRLISAIFRNPGSKDFLYQELQELFAAEYFFYKGKKYHSIISLVGQILEEHSVYLSTELATWE